MSSTQESDGDFQSWFRSSRWRTALYVGLPLLGVGVVCVLLWKRRSVEDTTPEPNEDIETPEPTLVWLYGFFLYFLLKEQIITLLFPTNYIL